jgi:hypothetical protein
MLTTESLKQMLDKDQNQDEVLVHLKISCSRALAEAILRGKCLTIKLEEDEQ